MKLLKMGLTTKNTKFGVTSPEICHRKYLILSSVFLMLGSVPTAVYLFVEGVQERLPVNIGLIVLAKTSKYLSALMGMSGTSKNTVFRVTSAEGCYRKVG
uniref:Uncharacterized protein n=1 Tax=Trichobilharzia regenti TaxID=157069 RepID=A0AA85J5W4_TRIRE|nr:unnamed protein product [Trichobilharzia regenti]